MSIHNLCFCGEVKKNMWIPPLIWSYEDAFLNDTQAFLHFIHLVMLYFIDVILVINNVRAFSSTPFVYAFTIFTLNIESLETAE